MCSKMITTKDVTCLAMNSTTSSGPKEATNTRRGQATEQQHEKGRAIYKTHSHNEEGASQEGKISTEAKIKIIYLQNCN